jgi:hypothetical protein
MLCAGAAVSAHAQWLNHPTAGIPRTKDGKPDLSARAPRAADGKPDLSGVWTIDPTPLKEMERLFPGLDTFAVPGDDPRFFSKFFINILVDFEPGEVGLRPEAAELLKQRMADEGKDVPTSKCLPAGIPMGDLLPVPRQYIQLPGSLVVLSEGANPHRIIYTDGRKHPVDPIPTWLGYSVGRWDGDRLVVETRGFNDRTWLDVFGHPRTESMRLTERFRRRDFGHMEVELTIDDPGAYTRPFSIRYRQTLQPDMVLLENVCAENERDRPHLVGR